MSLLLRLALMAAAVSLGIFTAKPPARALTQLEGPMLPSAAIVRALTPGHTELAADYFWLRLIQAAGAAWTPEEYRQVADYAELITELAPRFKDVYEFSGAFIPYNLGRDTWVNGEESSRIIRKGLEQFPDNRTLKGYLVFNLIYMERDYKAAAALLRELAQVPGAPPYLAQLATRLYAQAGEFDAGLEFARAMAANAETDEQRRFFEQRAKQIQAEQVLTEVDAAAWAYFRREGRQPTAVVDLLNSGDLQQPPVDPLGGEIVIDTFGRARSSAADFRLEVYEDATRKLARPTAEP
jgi:hypothetical protein